MPPVNRKSAPKVRDGRVQKKNNWTVAHDDYFAWTQSEIKLDRQTPGPGHRHVITIAELRRFLHLVDDWNILAVGLDAIVLATREDNTLGWHSPGIVALCAWERDLWWPDADPAFVQDHDRELSSLGVEHGQMKGGRLEIRWTEPQARAFLLLHVLPHELGHHHDRLTTRARRDAARGESYAEDFARDAFDELFRRYVDEFDI